MDIQVTKVTSKKEMRTFVRFGNKLYKGNKYYVPSMPLDDMATFDLNHNGAFEFSEAELYLAYKEGKVVGRVAAIINNKANETWGVKQVRFGWIDFIDDMEVSGALLNAVIGMTQIVGPLGFTDFDPEGMLVEGFDRISTMALIYNHPYYPEHMKKHGYTKETGWIENRMTLPDVLPEKFDRVADVVNAKYNFKVKKLTTRQIRKEGYGRKFFHLINKTYNKLYGFSLLSDKQIDDFVNVYLNLIDARMLTFIEDENGELVAGGISMPSIAEALQKCRGEIFPFGWWHLLKAMFWKRSDTVEFLLIGVLPEWQSKGVVALIFQDLIPIYRKLGFKYAETNAMLESNKKIQGMFELFDVEIHKRRWIFGKEI
mgnify:FL=1